MAGLVEILLGKENPVTQWTGRNSNLLTGLGTSLLSDGMNFAPAQQGAMMDRQVAQQKDADAKLAASTNATKTWLAQNYPDLAQAVDAGLPVSDAWQEAFKRQQPGYGQSTPQNPYMSAGDGQFFNYLTGEYVTNPNAPAGVNRTPLGTTIYTGRDAAGNLVPMQAGQGEFVPTTMPDGVVFDPGGMAGAKTTATVDAETAAKARAALRGAEVSNVNTAKAIAEVRNNAKGMSEWFGQIGPRGVYINPGSEMGKFFAAAEPTNNQAFMQAREALKGGGQITDFEGRKAEDAFSRMRASLEKGDQDQYLRALVDFEEAVALGYQKLRETAQGGYAAPATAAGGGGGDAELEAILAGQGL